LHLAAAIRAGDAAKALALDAVESRNEPALRIVATLIGQFRTWLWVKLMTEAGEAFLTSDSQAKLAIPNVSTSCSRSQAPFCAATVSTLPLLLELEVSLKQGQRICQHFMTK